MTNGAGAASERRPLATGSSALSVGGASAEG